MPLPNYGVGIGTFEQFSRDSPDNYGRFFHGHVVIRIPAGQGRKRFEAAVDVNKPDGGIRYLHLRNLNAALFAPISSLSDGYHELARTASSGALDYARSPLIREPIGCLAAFWAVMGSLFGVKGKVWTDNQGQQALSALEGMFMTGPQTPRRDLGRVYLFGAPYTKASQGSPDGVHDVHCNQGDPVGPFRHLDGIWQDGGVIVQYSDGHLEAFLVMFTTQTLKTNDQGLPV